MHSKEELPVWSIIASDGGGQSSKSTNELLISYCQIELAAHMNHMILSHHTIIYHNTISPSNDVGARESARQILVCVWRW